MKINFTLCLSVFILIAFSFTALAHEMGSIKGKIVSETGKPLENVNVFIRNTDRGTSTDENGSFSFKEVPVGKYTIEATIIGYEYTAQQIVVKADKTANMDFTMNATFVQLSEISVKGGALKAKNSTTTINVIKLDEIQSLNIDQPARLIEQVPGVDLGAYRQGGVADVFSIRGFGGGGHAGQAGVQVNGISLNEAEGHADGYADLNILIPINLSEMKVYKGPSSVLFGRFAQGGTLAFETRKGGDYQNVSISGGSFNTIDAQVALGQPFSIGKKKLRSNLAFQIYKTDGYSENSDFLKGNFSGRLSYNITDKTDIALSLRGHSSEWDAPGYIPGDQFYNKQLRNQQAKNAEDDGGSKNFLSQRLDINHTINDNLRLLIYGYSVQQNFTRFAKFGFQPGGQEERFNTRNVYSTGGSLNGKSSIGSIGLDWTAGLEYYNEGTDRKRWATSDRVREEQTEQRKFSIQSISAYAQGEFDVSQYFRPSIGLRYDTYNGSFTNEDPGQQEFTRELNNLSSLSPKIGVRSTLFRGFDVRASISNGFSLPNSTTKYDPDLNVEPTQLWQYETGINYNYKNWLELDAAAYILNTSQEVVENPPGSGVLVNAGMTQRRGIETKVRFKPIPALKLSSSFSYTETEIINNPEESLLGKELTSIPATISNFNLSYTLKSGIGAKFSLRDVGSYATSTDNSAYYDGYTVSDISFYYNFGGRITQKGRIFLEINNIFNEIYAESVFGSVGSQAFAPAPLRNFMMGISYNL